jgi:hypothetical protein
MMESAKHPATILATIDLVGLVTGFTYIQRQISDLNSKIESHHKDKNPKIIEETKEQFTLIARQQNELARNIQLVASQVKIISDNLDTTAAKALRTETSLNSVVKYLQRSGYCPKPERRTKHHRKPEPEPEPVYDDDDVEGETGVEIEDEIEEDVDYVVNLLTNKSKRRT